MATAYSSAEWKTARRLVLERDGWLCRVRGHRCTIVATTVDHVDPVSVHGIGVPPLDRLRAACRPCNSSLGATLGNRQRAHAARGYPGPSRPW